MSRSLSILLVCFSFFGAAISATAQECENWSESIQFLAQVPAANPDLCLADDDIGYTCGDELTIWDLSAPASPESLGTWVPPEPVSDLLVVGDYLYLACGASGI